jgi:hypothetical protein
MNNGEVAAQGAGADFQNGEVCLCAAECHNTFVCVCVCACL